MDKVEKVARAKALVADIVNLPYDLHAPFLRFMEQAHPETLAQLRDALAAMGEREGAMANDLPTRPSVPDGALWCQPGDASKARVWMVFFEDPDKGRAVFDNEAEAREFWARATLSWNCYLFQAAQVDASPRPVEEAVKAERAVFPTIERELVACLEADGIECEQVEHAWTADVSERTELDVTGLAVAIATAIRAGEEKP